MEMTDCELETNEINKQDMKIANEDVLKKQLEDFIRESRFVTLNFLTETTKCCLEKISIKECNRMQ